MDTVIACAHGTADPDGQLQIHALRRRISQLLGPDRTVLEASVDVQEPSLDEVVSALEPGRPAVILPLLLSTGFHTRVDMTKAAASHEGTSIAGPLGPDPRLAQALALRLREAGLRRGGDEPLDAVVLAAAGSSVAQGSADVHAVARELRQLIPNPVVVGFGAAAQPTVPVAVEQARALAAAEAGARVVAASYILASGYFHGVVGRSGAETVARPLLDSGDREWDDAAELVAQCAISRLESTRDMSE
jgi:sirohydrochlorin ferrochelatase